jgi:hypothetical protein
MQNVRTDSSAASNAASIAFPLMASMTEDKRLKRLTCAAQKWNTVGTDNKNQKTKD